MTLSRLRSDRVRQPILGALVIALLTLVGCGTTPASPVSSPPEGTATASGTVPSTAPTSVPAPAYTGGVVRPGHLTICSDFPSPPQEFYTEDGTPTGSDVDTGNEIGKRLGLQVDWTNSVFDTIIVALSAGKCDLIISGVFITEERQKQIDFVPYLTSGQQLLVLKGNPAGLDINDFKTLCGKAISSQLGGATVDTLAGYSKQCTDAGLEKIEVPVPTKANVALQLVGTHKADAFFLDSAIVGYYASLQPGQFELVEPAVAIVDEGIAVSKENPTLKQAVSDALKAMQADGTYKTILEQWGLGTVPLPEIP